MNVDKLLGSKTKAGILKYLIFKRQWVSMRALENDLQWSFTAIKKQVDSLLDSEVIIINKNYNKRSISINNDVHLLVKNFFLFSLEFELKKIFEKYPWIVYNYYLGKIFGKNLDIDIAIIYYPAEDHTLANLKKEIWEVFMDYFVDSVWVVFMSLNDFQKRYRLADKFVLNLIRNS